MIIGISANPKAAAIGKTDMNISPDSLQAFAQAANCGSLSAAARRLGKSQSTISEAVARLEGIRGNIHIGFADGSYLWVG